MDDVTKELRKMTRENFHALWQIAKTGDVSELSGEEKSLAKIMADHQDEYFNQFEMADLTYDHEYDVDTEENPFLHITLHSAVERQLEARDPIEAYQFYNSMRNKKSSHHDTIHLIATILVPFMFQVLRDKREFDNGKYISLLKKYKNRRPDRIYEAIGKEFDTHFKD